ncbi:Oidioi.mRNA.OKI2018_I69.XSR.g15746.t1.cds [Oikopleura dioica]|uniref:Oidioi.mRNA.OKI2018_I69.XSR.g15746.t1.cds n=1 Tax=Oikopleura dioica TaxID=34765 RepID=A0ABN7SI17_OIKDI|nr:Oidioi.mRNA.OKI2018_I69.XSR.g15746.t1.cds [Oikopleura dioica]
MIGPVPDVIPVQERSTIDIGSYADKYSYPDPEQDPYLTGKAEMQKSYLNSTIRPLRASSTNFFSSFFAETAVLFARRESLRVIKGLVFTIIAHLYLLNFVVSDHSSALSTFIFISFVQILVLSVSLVEQWARFKIASPSYHHGFDRAIIIASLTSFFLTIIKCASSIFYSLGVFVSSDESVHHFRHPFLISAGGIIFAFNLLIHYFLDPGSNHFTKLIKSCSTNPLQAEFHRLFKVILFSTDQPHPVLALNGASLIVIMLSDVFVLLGSDPRLTDSGASILLNLFVILTVTAWFMKCATVLLHGTFDDLSDTLEKLRLQITTMDGILEVKKHTSEPQFVLAEVIKKVHPVIPNSSIQLIKDDWQTTSKKSQNFTVTLKRAYDKEKTMSSPYPIIAPYEQKNKSISKLSSLIKAKTPKTSVNRLSTLSSLTQQ